MMSKRLDCSLDESVPVWKNIKPILIFFKEIILVKHRIVRVSSVYIHYTLLCVTFSCFWNFRLWLKLKINKKKKKKKQRHSFKSKELFQSCFE